VSALEIISPEELEADLRQDARAVSAGGPATEGKMATEQEWLTVIPAMPEREYERYFELWRNANRAFLEAIDLGQLEMDVICGGGQFRQLRLKLPIRWKEPSNSTGPRLP
jgi:hypothetical protein